MYIYIYIFTNIQILTFAQLHIAQLLSQREGQQQ